MKVFVLATLYNMQARGIAGRFGVSLAEARRQHEALFARFPGVAAAMRAAEEDGSVRGFAPITGGLRRHITPGPGSVNRLINTPIQATAAVVFRRAVIDLYRHYRGTPTCIILPIHDAVLIECDQADIEQVAREASLIMTGAVRAYFPELSPRVDVNTKATSCWSKDGHEDSLENFLKDPSFKL
jgi:DNA polymerase I-like protein with 3'-5' exonuclease and polymerase domains